MEKNKILSICIPTYNRPDTLERSLRFFLDEAKKYKIPIYISDDSTNDSVKNLINSLKREYPYFHYVRNPKPLGIEENLYKVLNLSDTKYRWLLGDDDSITKDSLGRILSILENNEDLDGIVVNACRLKEKKYPEKGCRSLRVKNLNSKLYTGHNKLLEDLGWHTTFMSTIIYNENALKLFDKNRYKGTIFPQFVLFYDYLSKKDNIRVYWDSNPTVFTINLESLGGASWFKNIITIFTKEWYEIVLLLPETYNKETKLKCILNHDKYTKVFSPLRLLYIRSFGYLNLNTIKKYSKYIPYTMTTNKIVVYFTAVFPKNLAKILRNIYIKFFYK